MPKDHKEANAWFEELYSSNMGNESQIPWARMEPNPHLEDYLKTNLPRGRALVVGCGLGDDAIALELANAESVTAIDLSESAIAWCKKRHDGFETEFRVEDLFELSEDLLEGFDFVFEAFTIQAIPLEFRDRVITAISSLVKPGGKLLVVSNGKLEDEHFEGPPWPLEKNHVRLFENKSMKELEFSILDNPNGLSRMLFRALYQKEL
jgi:SAM-dependent methyltransferase